MSKNAVELERQQTLWLMRVACWIRKATRARAHVRACAPTLTRKHAHALTYLRTQTRKCKIFLFHGKNVLKCGPGEGWRRSVGPIM